MNSSITYLIPDTNLFVQCRTLEELDWSAWSDFDEIHLIITRPVQKEIDNQKKSGNARLSKRARKTSGLFRKILSSSDEYILIHDRNPILKLFICSQYKPSGSVENMLDYREPDDQLVGVAKTFIEENPGASVYLLTHDTGPMASASHVNIPFHPIPDDWLLPPEKATSAKKIHELEKEVDRLREREPKFSIKCQDIDGNEIKKLETEFRYFEALSEEDIKSFIGSIKQNFPKEINFDSSDSKEQDSDDFLGRAARLEKVYTPASEDDIREYNEEKYPDWIERCENILKNLHVKLQRKHDRPYFCFVMSNDGTRPGEDALVTIKAKGNFEIMPVTNHDDEDDDQPEAIVLPKPPVPPRGRWEWLHPILSQSLLRSLDSTLKHFGSIGNLHSNSPFNTNLLSLRERKRDANALYWKPSRPITSGTVFELECDQWRHSVEPFTVEGDIAFSNDIPKIEGIIECQIHAGNMSDVAIKHLIVKISIKPVSVFNEAERLVNELLRN